MPEITFGGVPAWLLAAYLVELGGAQEGESLVRGEGWTATLTPHRSSGRALAIGRVTVAIEGARAEETMAALRKKAQRGGG